MKFYPEDYSVEVSVKFTDKNGDKVEPLSVSAVLFGGEDEVIVDFGSLPFEKDAPGKTITIPRQFNVLVGNQIRAPRVLRIEIETDAGVIPRTFSYAIEAEQRLVLMTNTFMTLEAAEFMALDTPDTKSWDRASEDQKLAAMTEAFRRLTAIPMKFETFKETGALSNFNTIAPRDVAAETVIDRRAWGELTKDDFVEKFPSRFKKALRRAQFEEACVILNGDKYAHKYQSGIVSETVGESSVTLRAGKVDYGISPKTIRALTGFIYFSMRIARA